MNYLQQRIQYLQRDREQRIIQVIKDAGYDPTQETDIKVSPSKEGWETLIVRGKSLISWTIEPTLVNNEIDFEYELHDTP